MSDADRFGGRPGGDRDACGQRPEPDAGRQGDGAQCRGSIDQDASGLRLHDPLDAQTSVVHVNARHVLGPVTLVSATLPVPCPKGSPPRSQLVCGRFWFRTSGFLSHCYVLLTRVVSRVVSRRCAMCLGLLASFYHVD